MHASRSHRVLVACATGFAILAAPASTLAQTVVTTTWSSTAVGDWSDPSRWTCTPAGHGFPNNSATAVFYANIGGGTVGLNDWYTVSRLTMTGGTLDLGNDLDINGNASFTNATILGDGTITVRGNASFANATLGGDAQTRLEGSTTQSGTLALSGSHTLVNSGAYRWTGALALGTGTSFLNGGTITSAGNTARTATGADATAGFANEGTFNKTGTGTTTFSGLRFDNLSAGTVAITGGTLALAGGGSSAGSFTGAGTVAFRGNFDLAAGTVSTAKAIFSGTGNTLDTNASLSGSAVTVSSGGAVTIDGSYNASATSIAGTATFNSASSTGTLALSRGGMLAGTNVLSVTGTATIAGGTMSGTGVTHLLKGSTTAQTGTLTLDTGRMLRNEGTYTWTGNLNANNKANFYNIGTVISGAGNRTAATTGSNSLFYSEGTFRKTGTGTTTFSTLPFCNRGTIDIQAGTLVLAGGGNSFGTISGAGTLALRGNYVIGEGSTSVANLVLSGGTAAAPNTLAGSVTSPTVNFQSGVTRVFTGYNAGATTIAGTANFDYAEARTASLTLSSTGIISSTNPGNSRLTVSDKASLAGGTISGSAILRIEGTASQSGTLALDSARIQVDPGAVYNWGAALNLKNSSSFFNTGTVVSGTGSRTATASGAGSFFYNEGSFLKTGTGTTTFASLPFYNQGRIDIQNGTLALAGGGHSFGTISGNGTLALRGNYVIGGDTSVANLVLSGGTAAAPNTLAGTVTSATVNFQSGITKVDGAYNVSATTIGGTATFNSKDQTGTLALNSGGTLAGTGTLAVTGATTISGGTMTGTGTTDIRGATTQSGTVGLSSGRTLLNDGSFSQRSTVNLTGSAKIINNATYTTAGTGTRTIASNDKTGSFTNAGSFVATTTTTISGATFTNTGTVDVQSGTLTLSGSAPQLAGGTVSGGTWIVGNGTGTAALAYTGTGVANITTIGEGASVTLRGTGSTFTRLNTLTTNQGAFSLLDGRNFTVAGTSGFANSGTLTVGSGSTFTSARGLTNTGAIEGNGTIIGTVTSSGTLATGASPGLLTFSNGLTLTSTNTTVMELGGTSRGITYDAINVGGTLTFAGTLDVVSYGGYETTLGTTYDLFDWSSATGMFTSINLPTLGTSLSWDLSQLYTTGMITAVPEPATCAALAGIAAAAFAFWRRRRSL